MTARHPDDPAAGPVHVLLQEVWSRGDLALVDDLVADDHVQHDPLLADPVRGPDALRQTVTRYRQAVPDLTKTVEETGVDGSTVVVRYTATGTHTGWLAGVEPTDCDVAVDGVYVAETVEGRLTMGHEMWDAVGLLRQLEVLPEPLADRDHP